jgi:hypothetical protein
MFKTIPFQILTISSYMTYSQIKKLTLSVLPDSLAICQFAPGMQLPSWAFKSSFFSISRTDDELSIVCDQSLIPPDVKKVDNWRAFKVEGPLDFSLTGIISSLAKPMAENRIPIFVISTYDTDYLLVENKDFKNAKEVLIKICSIKE